MRLERAGHFRREALAVDRERAACRQLVGVGRGHDQRGGAAHLLMQQPDGVGLPFVGAEGIGTDQLGEGAGLMRVGLPYRAHLVQHDRNAGLRDLPGGLASRQAATDDVNLACHGG